MERAERQLRQSLGLLPAPVQMDDKLAVCFVNGKETVIIVDEMLIGAVRALNFALVSWRSNSNELMVETPLIQSDVLGAGFLRMKAVGEF